MNTVIHVEKDTRCYTTYPEKKGCLSAPIKKGSTLSLDSSCIQVEGQGNWKEKYERLVEDVKLVIGHLNFDGTYHNQDAYYELNKAIFPLQSQPEIAEEPNCRTCATSSTNTGKFCEDMNCINHSHWVKYVPPEKQTAKQ